MAKLGEVCLLKAGKFVSANDISPEYNKGLYPCFGGNGIRGYVADYTHDGEFPLIGRQGALCGNVNLASGKFHATEHAVVVQPKIEMNAHWLYYALNAMNLGQYATGAAQPGLAVSKLETLSIEIPNISEQNKIAQTLCKVEQLVNFRKQQLAKLDELVKARFVEMFGDHKSDLYNWTHSTIGECCVLKSGTSLPADRENEGGNIPYIKVGDMNIARNRQYITTSSRFVTEQTAGNGIFPVGTVIFPKRGGAIGTNKKRLTVRPICADLNIMGVTAGKQLVSQYLMAYFSMIDLGKLNNGSSVPQINNKDIAPLPINLPPIKLQNQFSDFVERVDQQKQTVQQSLEKLELMKKALMQEYFG